MLINLKELLERIKDEKQKFPLNSLYGLSHLMPEEMALFREAWPEVKVERRRGIIRSLVEIAESHVGTDFSAIFRFCLGDEDEIVRVQAVEGLWEDEDLSLIGHLLHLLENDPSSLVRAAAATSLGRFVLLGELGEIEAAPALKVQDALFRAIQDEHETLEVQRRAVESIAYSGGAEVIDIIEEAYSHEDEKMRVSAVFAMGRNLDPCWNKFLLRELDSPNPEMRYEAACACGEMENPDAVPHLARLVARDPDPEVKEAAIWALGSIGGEEARRILTEISASEDESLREAAIEALENLDFSSDMPLYEFYSDFYDEYFDE